MITRRNLLRLSGLGLANATPALLPATTSQSTPAFDPRLTIDERVLEAAIDKIVSRWSLTTYLRDVERVEDQRSLAVVLENQRIYNELSVPQGYFRTFSYPLVQQAMKAIFAAGWLPTYPLTAPSGYLHYRSHRCRDCRDTTLVLARVVELSGDLSNASLLGYLRFAKTLSEAVIERALQMIVGGARFHTICDQQDPQAIVARCLLIKAKIAAEFSERACPGHFWAVLDPNASVAVEHALQSQGLRTSRRTFAENHAIVIGFRGARLADNGYFSCPYIPFALEDPERLVMRGGDVLVEGGDRFFGCVRLEGAQP